MKTIISTLNKPEVGITINLKIIVYGNKGYFSIVSVDIFW